MINFKLQTMAGITVVLAASMVCAQGPVLNPSNRPTFSPWLNLNRLGNSTAVNYYGLVRPQFAVNNSILQLQQQTGALQEQQQQANTNPDLPPTGHASGFLNHHKYFLNRGGATPFSGQAAAPTATLPLTQPKKRR